MNNAPYFLWGQDSNNSAVKSVWTVHTASVCSVTKQKIPVNKMEDATTRLCSIILHSFHILSCINKSNVISIKDWVNGLNLLFIGV